MRKFTYGAYLDDYDLGSADSYEDFDAEEFLHRPSRAEIGSFSVVRPAVVRPAVVRPAVVRPAVVRPAVVRPAVVRPAV
ncbi:hypothetical protein, partial [Actinoplanes sp. NPDC049316]|uniref:hypothetical protein n=1 Tax=Actinoplanes sp. NPDC049316 TaxID=3154727 RepID=UPI00341EC327